jgi:hypothetical protein
MNYDEAVLAGVQLFGDGVGGSPEFQMKRILSAIGFRQMQEGNEQLRAELRECWEFKEEQSAGEQYRKALDRIIERACRHCSAFEIAASACGLTWRTEGKPEDQFVTARRERDAARALVDQLALTGKAAIESVQYADTASPETYSEIQEDVKAFEAACEARDWK